MKVDKLEMLINRLQKIGLDLELISNYPWIYMNKVNKQKVKEKYQSDYGFTIAFRNEDNINFTDIKEIFKTIRKYKK
jgi:hypothetical protein